MKFEIFRSRARKPVMLTNALAAPVLRDVQKAKAAPKKPKASTPDFSHLAPRAGAVALPDVPFGHLVGPAPGAHRTAAPSRPEHSPAARAVRLYNELIAKS